MPNKSDSLNECVIFKGCLVGQFGLPLLLIRTDLNWVQQMLPYVGITILFYFYYSVKLTLPSLSFCALFFIGPVLCSNIEATKQLMKYTETIRQVSSLNAKVNVNRCKDR